MVSAWGGVSGTRVRNKVLGLDYGMYLVEEGRVCSISYLFGTVENLERIYDAW